MPNSLRNIYSQDIPKGRPGTFQQDVLQFFIVPPQISGENPNSLRDIYSQDIPKGRPGTFQQDVRGHSNRMSCNVLFLDFHLIFVPPMHIYEQLIDVRQL